MTLSARRYLPAVAVVVSIAVHAQGAAPFKIVPSNPSLGAGFGHSVAIDRDSIVIGAWQDDTGANRTQGSVTVLIRNGTAWTEQAKLTASDGATRDYFGQSVAIDGDTLAVGVPQADSGGNRDQGAVYIFSRQAGVWTEQVRLSAPAGMAANVFGTSVDLSGDTLVVGAPGTDSTPADKVRTADGAAHVFVRTNTTNVWALRKTLSAAGVTAFGTRVAIDGRTIAVTSGGRAGRSDGVHLFMNSGSDWVADGIIDAPRSAQDQIALNPQFDNLGLSGSTLVVGGRQGAAGVVFVHQRGGGGWARQATLAAGGGTPNDNFGAAADIDGDFIVVGAYAGSMLKGITYAFERRRTPAGIAWAPLPALLANDGEAGDLFGSGVGVSGTSMVVGASNQDLGIRNSNHGAAYVFGLSRQ